MPTKNVEKKSYPVFMTCDSYLLFIFILFRWWKMWTVGIEIQQGTNVLFQNWSTNIHTCKIDRSNSFQDFWKWNKINWHTKSSTSLWELQYNRLLIVPHFLVIFLIRETADLIYTLIESYLLPKKYHQKFNVNLDFL